MITFHDVRGSKKISYAFALLFLLSCLEATKKIKWEDEFDEYHSELWRIFDDGHNYSYGSELLSIIEYIDAHLEGINPSENPKLFSNLSQFRLVLNLLISLIHKDENVTSECLELISEMCATFAGQQFDIEKIFQNTVQGYLNHALGIDTIGES